MATPEALKNICVMIHSYLKSNIVPSGQIIGWKYEIADTGPFWGEAVLGKWWFHVVHPIFEAFPLKPFSVGGLFYLLLFAIQN